MPGPPPEVIKPVPCLSFGATELLKHFARGEPVVEFGSGGSTLWLAKVAWTVASYETDAEWHERMEREIAEAEILNAYVELVDQERPQDVDILPGWRVAFVDSYEPTRRPFLLAALEMAKPGCVIVADDSHFPSVAQVIEPLDRNRYQVEELIGTKDHPVRGGRVRTRTAFIHVR